MFHLLGRLETLSYQALTYFKILFQFLLGRLETMREHALPVGVLRFNSLR